MIEYERLSPVTVAALCFGLRNDSRVKMHIADSKLTLEQMLLGRIADELALIFWTKTVDGQKNINRPKPILDSLMNTDSKKENDNICYASGEDFMEAWRAINGGQTNG